MEHPILMIGRSPSGPSTGTVDQNPWKEKSSEDYEAKIMEGLEHHRLCHEIDQNQKDGGRHFVNETPDDTGSMLTDFAQDMVAQSDVYKVKGDMYEQPTMWITNLEHIAEDMSIKCNKKHRHVTLVESPSKACEVYQAGVIRDLLRGPRR